MMNERVRRYFENPRKIKAIEPMKGYKLLITFDNGELRSYDMTNELTGVFSVLKNETKFNRVFLNDVGNAAWDIDENIDSSVHWDNQIDLCKDMLYMESIPVKLTNNETLETDKIAASSEAKADISPTIHHDAINQN